MSNAFVLPKQAPLNSAGRVYPGAKAYFYRTGTNTPKQVFEDAAHATPFVQPVEANLGGTFPVVYLDTSDYEYRVTLTTSGDALIYTTDNVGGRLTQDEFDAFLSNVTADQLGQVLYFRTAGEIAASVTPTRYQFVPGDVRRYCTAVETNHEAAFIAAHAANEVIYAPAGTWNVDHFVIETDGRRFRTDGFATIVKQRLGNLNRRTIEVCASNITIDDIKVEGNIATATGEQQAGVFVSGNNPNGTNANIQNIRLGNIWGENIRGDVLEIAAPAGFTTTGVTFGVVRGTNVYRNVVSIVGASYITGVGITTDGGCGYETFDIEPNVGGTPSTDITIGWIRGGNVQCAPPSAGTLAQRIRIGSADLNPAYQPNSTPGYSEGGSSYAVQIRNAVNLRNTIGFSIGYLKMRNHSHFGLQYIYNGGETRGRNIHIGYLDASGVGASEVTINALLEVANIETLTIDDGEVSLQTVGDYVMAGSSATRDNSVIVNRMKLDGTLIRFGSNCRFSQILRDDTNNAVLIRECDRVVLESSNITAPVFITNVTGLTVLSSAVTCSGTYLNGTNSNLSFINCSGGLASILAGSATYDPPSLADGAGATTTLTMTGLALGDYITHYAFSLDLQGISLTPYVSAANTGSFRFQNESGGLLDLASGTLKAKGAKA